MKLQKAILMYRAKHSMSQRDFAEKCGLAMQTVYNVETVGQKPSKITKTKIEIVIGDEFPIDPDGESEDDTT